MTTGIGYHTHDIPKGVFGELSKITEELHELIDADAQDARLMVLLELSDIYGAIEGYLAKHHPSINMEDLKYMSSITQRAFRNGHR